MEAEYGSVKITIDLQALAQGFKELTKEAGSTAYEGMTDGQKDIVSIGMAPNEVMEKFSTQWESIIMQNFRDIFEKKGIPRADLFEVVPKKWFNTLLSDCNREFYLGILDGAEKEGRLLV